MTTKVPTWEQLNPAEKVIVTDDMVDNRDLRETWLRIPGYGLFVIDPTKLFAQAIECAEQDGPIYVEVDKQNDGENNWTLQLSFTFSTEEEHDEDNDVEIVKIDCQNEPQLFGKDYT